MKILLFLFILEELIKFLNYKHFNYKAIYLYKKYIYKNNIIIL